MISWRARCALVTIALAAAACGPYAEVAQKLDVTAPYANAETWVAAAGSEIRVLVLGGARSGGPAGFTLTILQTPVTAGISASELQGDWTADSSAAATFTVHREYLYPDERGTSMLARVGVTRTEANRSLHVGYDRSGRRLAVTGDAQLAGDYRRLREALADLGSATERDAACAFQVVNLAVRATQVRIVGFGGPGMTQYQNAATFSATLDGSFRVTMEGLVHNRTTIEFTGLVELGGTRLDGTQVTEANSSGDGQMSGVVAFSLQPLGADGTERAAIDGTLDYGAAGNPAEAIQIRGGSAVGGHYTIALQGGGTAQVRPETAPSPSLAECLTLP